MNNNKINLIIAIFICSYSVLMLLLSIINSSILSSKTEEYKDFKNSIENYIYYYDYSSANNNYTLKKDEAKKIINDFIDLQPNESFSVYFRVIISILSILYSLFFYYFFKKIRNINLNESQYRKNNKCIVCSFIIIFIIEMMLIFFEIVDSIVMINFRNENIIPYIKDIFIDDSNNKFNSRMKTSKNFDFLFIILLLIIFFVLILLEIKMFNKNINFCIDKCCGDNQQQEINPNQNRNKQNINNVNNNQNINNRNVRRIDYIERNIDRQYVNNYPNRNNNINLHNNFNSNIQNSIENLNRMNNNDIINEIHRDNNNEAFFKNFLKICHEDKFNKNKYKNHEKCIICLMNFQNDEQILILPCLHIFHKQCIINWLKNRKTCPLDNQNLELYL